MGSLRGGVLSWGIQTSGELRRLGQRRTPSSGEIEMYSMNHCKSIFHEMYHDLDWKTNHLYISDDHTHNPKYPNGYGWAFAELLWAKIREELSRPKQSGSLLTAFTD